MKLKKHRKSTLILLAIIVCLTVGLLIKPPLCGIRSLSSSAMTRYQAEHVSEPAKTAVLSVVTAQQYPNCYAPLSIAESKRGWTYPMAQAIRSYGYSSYVYWNNFISILLIVIGLAFLVNRYVKNRKGTR
ncbi:MAG: hypothetical protein WBO82_07345 [Neisseria sp.]